MNHLYKLAVASIVCNQSFLLEVVDGFSIPSIISPLSHQTNVVGKSQTFVLYGKDNKDDDFLFDPLLSPHAYPNGTPSSSKPAQDHNEEEEDWSPMKMKHVKDDFVGATDNDYVTQPSSFTTNWSNSNEDSSDNVSNDNKPSGKNDVLDNFDPRISPHSYPSGIPDPTNKSKDKATIGIVLIDHGSRRASSNDALMELASTIQQTYFSSSDNGKVIVQAAHMEIVEPSIMSVVQDLVTQNPQMKTIICHPYFLSPGRHVTEDIPQLIQEAQEWAKDYSVDIQTTPPIGANPQIMAQLIHQVLTPTLQENGYSSPTCNNDNNSLLKDSQPLGGLFGEIQRMLEEEDA